MMKTDIRSTQPGRAAARVLLFLALTSLLLVAVATRLAYAADDDRSPYAIGL